MKKIVSMMLLLAMALTLLTACGGGSGSKGTDVTGKWDITKMEVDGEEQDLEMLTQLGLEMYMEFTSDGKTSLSVMGQSMEGTYKVDGNKVELTFEGQTQTAEVSNNKMTMEQDGAKMTLEKQK